MRIRGAVLEAKGGPFVVEAGVVERSRSAVTSLAPADHVKGGVCIGLRGQCRCD